MLNSYALLTRSVNITTLVLETCLSYAGVPILHLALLRFTGFSGEESHQLPVIAGTAKPFRVSPPEAVVYLNGIRIAVQLSHVSGHA